MAKKTYEIGTDQFDPPGFVLTGRTSTGNAINPIEFDCLPQVQGTFLEELVGLRSKNNAEEPTSISAYLRRTIVPEQRERFDGVVQSEDVIVELNLLVEILTDLIEVYVNRPTQKPSHSPNGHLQTEPTSTASLTGTVNPIQDQNPSLVTATPYMP